MSDQQQAKPPRPTPRRSPWATALMILTGILMLLPGLCSLIFSAILITSSTPGHGDPGLWPLIIFCFLVGVGGVALIVSATRR